MSAVAHPFYPTALDLAAYAPPTRTMGELLTAFFGGVFALLAVALVAFTRGLTAKNRAVFVWFAACALIHTFFEGYFVVFNRTMSADTSLFGEIWKEYALSDSRYLTSDPTVLMIEAITAAVWGPLSFYVCYLLATTPEAPLRYWLQLVVSMGQGYGCVLYYLTTLVEGAPHCRPEQYYFWFYFFFINAFWVAVPAWLVLDAKRFMDRNPPSKYEKLL